MVFAQMRQYLVLQADFESVALPGMVGKLPDWLVNWVDPMSLHDPTHSLLILCSGHMTMMPRICAVRLGFYLGLGGAPLRSMLCHLRGEVLMWPWYHEVPAPVRGPEIKKASCLRD